MTNVIQKNQQHNVTIVSFHFLVTFRTTFNTKFIIVNFNFSFHLCTIFYHKLQNWCFSLSSFKTPIFLVVKLSLMLTCVSFNCIIANKCNDDCSWFITRNLLLTNMVSCLNLRKLIQHTFSHLKFLKLN